MSRKSRRGVRTTKIALLAGASYAFALSAQAQTQTPSVESVVVTGTQIHGVPPVGSNLISVDQAAIQDTGLLTTDDIIRSLPQISNLGANAAITGSASQNATLNITRANGINLRGLGPQATLVLVDGRRPAPEGVGAQLFDPSGIPALAVSRIDVVADGASATYGADAVAGVVNVILRKNFAGLEASVSGTTADGYNGNNQAVILGKSWDGGSFMVAGEHQYNTALETSSRPGLFNSNQTSVGGYNQNLFATVPGNLCPATTCSLTSTRSPVVYGIPNQNGVGLTAANLSTTPNTVNSFSNQSIIPEMDRVSLVAAFNEQLLPDLTVRAEGFHTARHYFEYVANLTRSVTVPSSNPFYVPIAGTPACPASLGAPAGNTCETVAYDFSNDLGKTRRTGHEINEQIDVGADYNLPGDFTLSGDLVYSSNEEFDWVQALNATATTAAILNTNPATSLNVFGNGTANNPATLASLLGYNYRLYNYESKLGSVHLDGPVYKLPAGSVRVAIGGEVHADQLRGIQIGNNNAPNVSTLQVTSGPTIDTRTVRSVFGEIMVPVFSGDNAIPGFQKLNLDVALRYDDYSDFGPTTNPKFGIQYMPINDLTLNASYGTSFRAPTLSQKDPASTAVAFYDNPAFSSCACHSIMLGGGNAAIRPETATTMSVGAQYKPSWLDGLKANLTFFHVDYKNIIDNPGSLNPLVLTNPLYSFLLRRVNPATNPVDLAYVQGILSTPYYANAAALPATSYNLVINGAQVNVGESRTSGLDFDVNYVLERGDSQFNAGVSGEYLTQYDYSLVPGAPFADDLNDINFPLRFKGRFNLGWSWQGLRVNGFLNYVNGYTDNITPATSAGLTTTQVSAYTTADLSVAYTPDLDGLAKDITVALNVQNLFDTDPSRALNATYRYDGTVGNPLGRQVSLQLRKSF